MPATLRMTIRHILISSLVASAPLAAQEEGGGQASAQEAGSGGLEEVVVTARKQEERLIDAPVSITAFTADDIDERAMKTLEDVARLSPGVQYSQQGGQAPGRYTSAIRFRGMNVNSDSPSLQLGALFIDGVYVLGGTQSIPYDDVERIEVVKGPQAALYGRSTFGGAINYITRTPSLTEYSGRLSLTTANYEEDDVSASFEGPIIEDKLAFRVGGRYYSRGGLFNTSDGGELGEESSRSAQLSLLFKPVEALEIKLRGFYAEDEDGPPAGGLVSGFFNNSCAGQQIPTEDPAVPIARPNNYICGTVPENGVARASNGLTNVLDTPTTLRPQQAQINGAPNFVIDNLVNRPNPPQVDVPTIDHIGLVRIVQRYALSANYEFGGGYTLTGQAGFNDLEANWIRAFGVSPLGRWFSRDPQDSTDESYELRISSPTDGRFSWLAGINYYDQSFIQSGSGGDSVWFCFQVAPRPAGSPCTNVNFFTPNTLLQNTDTVETLGYFASVNFDITDAFTISLEGRWQEDEARSAVLTPSPFVIEDEKFLPRAILRFQPNESTNIYASYSQGLLPGIVNAQIASATPFERQQYATVLPNATDIVEGDELDMLEIGWKQQFLDNRANTAIAAYYGEWKNQKGRVLAVVQETCGSPSHGVGGAECVGRQGQPAVLNGVPFVNSRNVNVPGDSTLWGVEAEGAFLLADNWDVRATLTYARSEYDDFIFNFVFPIAGFNQMKGNSNARFPEWTGSLASGYQAPIRDSDWQWFVNGDASYFGKAFVDESNLASCDAYWLANLRAGGEKDGLRIEAFVRNVFDDDSWAACARWTDFDFAPSLAQLTTFQGVAVTAQTPRQYGIRATIKF